MNSSEPIPHVWQIRALTANEVSAGVDRYSELLAGMVDMAPTYPMADPDIRNSLFHLFVEWTEFAREILATTNPPYEVLANVAPRTAAALAIAILEKTRASMPTGFFTKLVAEGLRDTSGYLSGVRQ